MTILLFEKYCSIDVMPWAYYIVQKLHVLIHLSIVMKIIRQLQQN